MSGSAPEGRGKLSDRVAVVTGGTSGIGRAIAVRFAAEGARVIIAGRSAERGGEVVADVEGSGGSAAFCQVDVTKVADCERLIADAVQRWGKVDILVNAAGVFPLGPSHEVTEEDFDRAIESNLKGPFFCGQAAIRHMLERGEGGKVINLSSIAALIGFAGASVYSLTKGALLTLTKTWAVEYAPHRILVNAIAPGNVETPMNESLMADPDYKAAMLANTPLARNGQTEDIVPAALLLASDDGNYFCGATLVIDGGWVAR